VNEQVIGVLIAILICVTTLQFMKSMSSSLLSLLQVLSSIYLVQYLVGVYVFDRAPHDTWLDHKRLSQIVSSQFSRLFGIASE
jgi:hypothetical protein